MALTDEQRRYFEGRLHEERERVLRIIHQADELREASEVERSGDITYYPFHLADIGTESFDQEMGVMQAQRATHELGEIDDALRRLYKTPDRFGICEDTGEPIPFERLDLVPWARTCGDKK